jgi:hypothetical protein
VGDVVVDEWIIIRALDLEDPAQPIVVPDQRDFRPAELLAFVQDSCRWVISDETMETYLRRLYHSPYHGTLWRRVRTSIYDVIGDLEKRRWVNDPPVVAGRYHRKDALWVSAAVAVGGGCRLITGDDNLVADLIEDGLAERAGIVPMGLSDAHNWSLQ